MFHPFQTQIYSTFFFMFVLLLSCNNSDSGTNEAASVNAEEQATSVVQQPVIEKGTMTVADQTYSTLTIDGVIWLGENLNVAISESWCYDLKPSNCEENGRLYRWAGAKQACAALGDGWRLPSETEWRQLATTFGGYTDWLTEETFGDPIAANRALIASNSFGATLGGWRGSNGGFDSADKMGFYWTDTEYNEDDAWFYIALPEGNKLTRRSTTKRMGMSCRCVK